MAAEGVPRRVAVEIPGHAQTSTTMNVYTRVAQEMHTEAAVRIEGALWPAG